MVLAGSFYLYLALKSPSRQMCNPAGPGHVQQIQSEPLPPGLALVMIDGFMALDEF
jgi:hypothetical protein